MRITRAYTITPEVKRILDTKVNKSEYVCRAVRKLHTQMNDVTPADFTTKQLLAAYLHRIDMNDPIRALIVDRIQAES
tara:strand:- start:523 stop:756 length:234 start_codon:yes stop_codon:yes gene_type:complete